MAGRQRTTRQARSVEPAGDSGTRQPPRRSARRAEASIEIDSRPQPEIAQRGTRRRRRRSLESIATNDFPKSSASHASPGSEDEGIAQVAESIGTDAVPKTDPFGESLDMDPERIQDLLDYDIPKLMRWCNKMYDVLLLMNSQQPDEHDMSKYRNTSKGLNAAQVPFAAAEGYPLFIKSIDLPEDDPEVQAKVQTAICSGNLISLLTCIVDLKLGLHQPEPVLDRIDAAFPILFNPNPTAETDQNHIILDLAFRIRYRRLVELVATGVPMNSVIIRAAQMFCTQNIQGVKGARDALNNGPYSKIGGIDVGTNVNYHDSYRSRIQELLSNLSSDNLEMLDEEHPQETLFDDLKSWALESYERLNRASEPGSVRVASPTPRPHASIEQGEVEAPLVDNSSEVREVSDSDSDTDGEYDQFPEQDDSQSFINNSAILAAVRQSEIATTPLPDRQAAKGKGKAPEIGDAIRSLDPGQFISRLQKRARSSGNDESEDDDFEVNKQLLDTYRAHRHEASVIHSSSPKRPRYSKRPPVNNDQSLSRMSATQRVASEHLRDSPSTEPRMKERDILVLSQGAQNTRRANIKPKPRQVRVPWTAPEIQRLLDLIADPSLKCSWSAMEEEGGFENYRNQQALRDKARSLKVWFLEADKLLPPGFDQVALGQKEKDAVMNCRKNPNRREDDVDESGGVINNIWVE
ncbi:hypothetical protein GGR53DRAFT_237191 [Hypoxylon sp. FL1150]|nr:hypothetical protein GGR53DRAFT_237191 [Hypoxylon sp. FL1150]